MKKGKKSILTLKKGDKPILIFTAIIVILILILMIFYVANQPKKENEVENFCLEKCGIGKMVSYSKNSTFNFIECECAIDVYEPRGYTQSLDIEAKMRYFDSESLEELSEEDILLRIK